MRGKRPIASIESIDSIDRVDRSVEWRLSGVCGVDATTDESATGLVVDVGRGGGGGGGATRRDGTRGRDVLSVDSSVVARCVRGRRDAATRDARGGGARADGVGGAGDGNGARGVERARVDEWERARAVDDDDGERKGAGAGVGVGDAEAGVEFAARVVGAGLRLDEGDGDERTDGEREHGTQSGGAEIV